MLNTQGNLYGTPNSVLGNADALMNNINTVAMNGAGNGFANYNGINGCLPLAGDYTPVPGYGSIPNFGGSNNIFGLGYASNSNPFYDTNISYNRTNNPDGSFSTNYHAGSEMNSLGYVNAIGSGIVGGLGYYFQSKAAQEAQETQQQGQMLAYMAQKEQYTQNMGLSMQQAQFNMKMQTAQLGLYASAIKSALGNQDLGNA